MPRVITSLIDRDPKTNRLRKAIVLLKDGYSLEIKVIPAIAAFGGRTFQMDFCSPGTPPTLLGSAAIDVVDMRGLRDYLTRLLDEHFDTIEAMVGC